jgi:hypothetical protein
MSIPIRFDFYNKNGHLLARNRGFFTFSYGQDPANLTLLLQRISECSVESHRKFIHPDVRYIVPLSATDYMFDLENLNYPLPNRFK